ncbi:hypothetical protein WK72_21565 [Burkholderia ubonensis]|nr:hypothetical protein WJ31_22075 [Burkholderia ubonensis]KVU63681.1 hypothetical protein WK72_21565 [Burkholderia ubonensis]
MQNTIVARATMIGRIAKSMQILDRFRQLAADESRRPGKLYLRIEIRTERGGHELSVVSGSVIWRVQFRVAADILRMFMQHKFNCVIDQHQRESVEIPVLERELVKCQIHLVKLVRKKLNHTRLPLAGIQRRHQQRIDV